MTDTRTDQQLKDYAQALADSARDYRDQGKRPQENHCHEAINRVLDELQTRS